MKINEIKPKNWLSNGEYIEDVNGYKFFVSKKSEREVYFFVDNKNIVSYGTIFLNKHSNNNYWWMDGLWVDVNYRGKGLATKIIDYIKSKKDILFLDSRMSVDS